MAAGLDVTVPLPVPARAAVSVHRCSVKVAVTVLLASIVTVHVEALPEHAPVQPANVQQIGRAHV